MIWVIVVLLIGFIIWRVMPIKGIESISTGNLKAVLKDKNKQFIDVRTPAEYKARHIKEFKNIPLNTLNNRIKELDQSKEIVVICQSGMRSSQAAKQLKKAGFSNILNVSGGMNAWHN